MTEKSKAVLASVGELYQAGPPIGMGKWMWNNHVQAVASIAKGLAEKYGADAEKAYCAVLIHDLADCQHPRNFEKFASWSEEKGKEVLFNAGFSEDDASEIVDVIVHPHSCHAGDPLPTTLEGKILATSDAMWHLQTSFFPMLCYKQRPEKVKTYEEWQEWFDEKIEREFSVKIFFEDERAEAKEDYEALSRVFKNRTLDSKES